MEKKLTVAGVIVALALGVVGLFTGDVTNVNPTEVREVVGGVSSDSSHKFFGDGITIGGRDLSTTTGVTLSSYTLTAKEVANHTVRINPSVDLTLLISATSTGALVPNVGDEYTFLVQNASSTAASGITFDNADASVQPLTLEATGADLKVDGTNWAKVTIVRTGSTGTNFIKFLVTEFIPG